LKLSAFKGYYWLLPVLLLAFGGLCLYVMRPDVAGFFYDDGMYLMAAQSLANGHGYRLEGMPGHPLFYKYPPLYPLALAGLMLPLPDFPANVVWLKAFNSLLSMMTLGLLAYHFGQQRRLPLWITLGLLVALGTNWRFIAVSTELMSEPLFMALSVLTIVLAERFSTEGSGEGKKLSVRQMAVLIGLSVAGFYTRTMGVVLILALGAWLGLRGRKKAMSAYWGISGAFMLPWFLWSGSRPDTTYPVGEFLVRTFQETYFQSFRMDLRYEYTLPEVIYKGAQDLLGNFAVHFFPLLERLLLNKGNLAGELFISLLSALVVIMLGFRCYQAIRNKTYSLPGIYVALYLATLPCWSFYDFYPRFSIVILPFLFVPLIKGIQGSPYSLKVTTGLIILLLGGSIISNVIHLSPHLQKPYRNTLSVSPQPDLWAAYTETFNFIKAHTPAGNLLYNDITDEGYFYALNTGRPFLDIFVLLPKQKLEIKCPSTSDNLLACYRQLSVDRALVIREVLKRERVGYLVYNHFAVVKAPKNDGRMLQRMMPVIPVLAERFPQEVVPVFQSGGGWITVYQFRPNREVSGKPSTD